YVIQRAEALVGLFYLTTLYCAIRARDSSDAARWLWPALAVAACLLGMATKEVMVSAPLLVLLHEWTFGGEAFGALLRRRRWFYLALAATWLPLAYFVLTTGGRGGTAGFGAGGIEWWAYLFTQCRAIVLYLALAVWPANLVFDYGIGVERSLLAVAPQAALLVVLAIATIVAVRRRSAWGFLGAWFFALLAPSSSVVPVATETIAEHRMYLALAAVVAAAVLGAAAFGRRAALGFFALAALAAAAATVQRNKVYRDPTTLWRDCIARMPTSPRPHNNLGEILFREGRQAEAIAAFREAVRLLPSYVDGVNNLANSLTQIGQIPEAIQWLQASLRVKPEDPHTHHNLGNAYYGAGRLDDAARHYRLAIKLQPDWPDPYNNLGVVLGALGRATEAVPLYETALKLKPDYANAHFNFANALVDTGRPADAEAHFHEAIRLDPANAEAFNNLGKLHFVRENFPAALAAYEAAIKLNPDFFQARNGYGAALFRTGRLPEAIRQFEEALRINPNDADARNNLDFVRRQR
ncbi:MAG: repeat-containing protein YrrB, partial [Verrucomicrobiota bacterium]